MFSCLDCELLEMCSSQMEWNGVMVNADVHCKKFKTKKKIHHIKLDINFCDDVLSGRKNFEIRENDRLYQTRDLVLFTPINSKKQELYHTIREKIYEASGWGIKEGWVVFGIKEFR